MQKHLQMRAIARRALPIALSVLAVPAAHAGVDKLSVQSDYVDYSDGHGLRRVSGVEATAKLGDTTVVLGAMAGSRDYGAEKHHGSRFTSLVYHDWTKRLSTRTAITASTNSPVFVRRELQHDFNIKLVRNVVMTLGGKHSEYFGGVRSTGWIAGGAWYTGRMIATYRFGQFDMTEGDDSTGHLLSMRLKDRSGDGLSQLWLGKGASLETADTLSDPRENRSRSVAVRRVQPLGGGLSLNLTLGKTLYDNDVAKHHAISSGIGLAYDW
jgi:YaiO family outer membrane protein